MSISRCYVLGILLLGMLCLHTTDGAAQQQAVSLPRTDEASIQFKQVTIGDGLSQQAAIAMMQDRRGFMWFGTWDGLNRYDGYEFNVYQHNPEDPGSLRNSRIEVVLEDHQGVIWIALWDGLSRYDPKTETFSHHLQDRNDPGSPSYQGIFALLEDREGTLWVGTRGDGLARYDRETETFTYHLPFPDQPEHGGNFVYTIVEDQSGVLWAGTRDGLYRFDRASDAFTPFRIAPGPPEGTSDNLVTKLYEDRQGTLWVGAWGLHRFDRDTGTFEHYLIDAQETIASRYGANRVLAILEDDTGALWVGGSGITGTATGGGLNRFDRDTGVFTRYLHDPADPTSLNSNNVLSIYQDRQGVLWVGTDSGGGLNLVDRTARPFTTYPAGSLDANSLQGGAPRGMHLDQDDVLWIGTMEGVLNRLDRQRGTYTQYRHDPADPQSLLPGFIVDVYRDRQGQLWVSSTSPRGGLSRLDEATGHFTHFKPPDVESMREGIGPIYEDRKGQFWVGGRRGGLYRFNREEETFTQYHHDPEDPNSIGGNWVAAIYEDQAGALWIGHITGSTSGLSRFDPSTETFTHYLLNPGNPKATDNVFGFHERPQEPGILWVATEGLGLTRLDVTTGQITRYTSQNSDLPSNTVYGVYSDADGDLWMSSIGGLARFNPDTEQFKTLNTQEGVQRLEFDIYAYHQGYNGELFFGGVHGVVAIQPGDMVGNPHQPEVALSGLQLFDEPVSPGPDAPLKTSITEAEAVTLKHNENDLTLDYVGLHFANPARIEYAYMLEGYDDDWREVGTERRARYFKLPPASYTFRVKAANSDGIWNDEGTSLSITILPPWWRTWWAYAVYGLVVFGGVFVAFRLQRRRLIAREQAKAKERELEQARKIEQAYHELNTAHTQLKSTQAQLVQQEKMASLGQLTAGIAHEIKNPLNFINNFAEVNAELADELEEALREGEDPADLIDDLRHNATVIAQHGKRADGIVKSMMAHARTGSGERMATDLNALVNEHIDLAYHGKRAQVPDFSVTIERELDDAAGEIMLVPQDIGRVVLNLLSNAFDVLDGREDARVTVATRRQDGQVEIRVADNGPGMSKEVKAKVFEPFFTTKPTGQGTGLGLSLSYDIVTQGHAGTMTVESAEGEGATFVVAVPGGTAS